MEQAARGARAERKDILPHKSWQTERAATWKSGSEGVTWGSEDVVSGVPTHFQTCVVLRGASWKVFQRCLSLTHQLGSQFQRLPSTCFLWLTWRAPTWVLSLHHPWLLSLLHLEDHFCFGDWTPCSWETTQNWGQSARNKRLPYNLGLPPGVLGPVKITCFRTEKTLLHLGGRSIKQIIWSPKGIKNLWPLKFRDKLTNASECSQLSQVLKEGHY